MTTDLTGLPAVWAGGTTDRRAWFREAWAAACRARLAYPAA
ncbi:MAG TPA: hypothetical protein VH723_02145 [Candidatus Limnocylindrales bacterium]|jgi:hypothetical protein